MSAPQEEGDAPPSPAQVRALWWLADDPYYLTKIGGARQGPEMTGGPRISPATLRRLRLAGWAELVPDGRRQRVKLTEAGRVEAERRPKVAERSRLDTPS